MNGQIKPTSFDEIESVIISPVGTFNYAQLDLQDNTSGKIKTIIRGCSNCQNYNEIISNFKK